jgi:alkanesulfonate monooxygenase SsuD/methylene tetrahydromethanopterin reductase-like flavin-dependent oxidoreductase (luciferase family)
VGETRGCIAALLCEHHCADDGYLPSPLLLASAIAARTQTLLLNLTITLPFYDPARLAEDIAVLDHIGAGRVTYIFGIGYRQEEYDHFGLSLSQRGKLADEKLGILRRLLSGETVEHDGRRMVVTPQPRTRGGPMMSWGRASLAASHRAGRNGLGCWPRAWCPACGRPTSRLAETTGSSRASCCCPTVRPSPTTARRPVLRRVESGQRGVGEHHPPADRRRAAGEFAHARDPVHRRGCAEGVRRQVLNVSSLCGGIPPAIAWPYQERAAGLA